MKILIAEDDSVSALVLRKTLEKLGHTVTVTTDGAKAWERLQEEEFRLVISDWMMPEMSGIDLCRAIRERLQGRYTYFILLTAKDQREDRLNGLDAGADDFLLKPLDVPELIARLETGQRILTMQSQLEDRQAQLTRALGEMEAAHKLTNELNSALETEHRALAQANEQLKSLATTDGMTGLTNHITFQERLREEISRANRQEGSLCLLLMDVDKFKQYNDTYGHPAGDEVLKGVARLIKSTLRAEDVAARYGGEEFSVLLPGLDADKARTAAERIRSAIASHEFPNRLITMSIGLSELKRHQDTPQTLIEGADRALYAAKHGGRNQVVAAEDMTSSPEETATHIGFVTSQSEQNDPQNTILVRWGFLEGLLQEPAGQILAGVLAVLERRQAGSEGHSQRVARFSLRLAQEVAKQQTEVIDPGILRELALGALLHDIGKTAISTDILTKPGPLEPEERQEVRRYPIIGMELLQNFPLLEPALAVVRHQHEWWDGTGYPDGLIGNAIPLAARIFSVVNALDAMLTNRPYRSALSYAEALAEIQRSSGTQFDPFIVEAFEKITAEEWHRLSLADNSLDKSADVIMETPLLKAA